MARHEGVIGAAHAELVQAQSKFTTIDTRVKGIEHRYSHLPTILRPLVNSLTASTRAREAAPFSLARQVARRELEAIEGKYDLLLGVDGLELTTYREGNCAVLEQIRGAAGKTNLEIAHLLVYGDWLRGPKLTPVPGILRESFGGFKDGQMIGVEAARAFFNQFNPVLSARNKIEEVADTPYSGNVTVLYHELTRLPNW